LSEAVVVRILVTGGAGFIGSAFVDYLVENHTEDDVVVVDKLTYAGNLRNLLAARRSGRLSFFLADICEVDMMTQLLAGCEYVVNFAAESHVDRSLADSTVFVKSNVLGVQALLTACRRLRPQPTLIQISTDEVYGEKLEGESRELDALKPRNPYSASKAAAELLLRSYYHSFESPVRIVRGTNNFGPRQHGEKLIPTLIRHALRDKPLPIYGDGLNIREWIYVADFAAAIDVVMRCGKDGETYNAGGGAASRLTNFEVACAVLESLGKPRSLLTYIEDRPGHDRRYAVNPASRLCDGPAENYRVVIKYA